MKHYLCIAALWLAVIIVALGRYFPRRRKL